MVKRYRTVSTRIEEGLFNKFLDVCESKDCKPNTMLKNYVEDVVKNVNKGRMVEVERGNRQEDRFNNGSREEIEETGLPWGEPPENKHLHTLKEQIDCPDCYPDIRKKVYDKEFKDADATCIGCGLLAKKEEARKENWECPNCGSKDAEEKD